MKLNTLKILYQWPLSKVELVETNGKKYILKTIHNDFTDEIKRQQMLYKKTSKIKIPKIHYVKKEESSTSFLMDYIPSRKKEIGIKKAIDIANEFNNETKSIHNKYFQDYNFEKFYQDFKKVRKNLNNNLSKVNYIKLKEIFSDVFSSERSIVHGDWGKDQILNKGGKYYIIDFGKSFRGPSILDYAHLYLKDKKNKHYRIPRQDDSLLLKAKIIVCIITLNWFELCKSKYIPYKYEKEIKEYANLIDYNFKKLYWE